MHAGAKTFCLIMLSLIISGCTKVGLFVANIPAELSDYQVFRDVSYGEELAQKLDLYVPPKKPDKSPVLVFFYGGRWTDGHKEQYRFVADTFIKEGYIVAIPDYRKYPDVKFPTFAEDAAKAVAWIQENIVAYGGNPEQIFVVGHSSGAHIGALIATDPKYLRGHNLNRHVIKAFAGLSGPYAFVPEAEDLKDMFGPPDRYPLMRAPNFVDGQQPPMLLIHGLKDTTVVLLNAEKLKSAIEQNGGDVKLATYKNLNHVETIGSLMWFWSYKSNIKEEIVRFFSKYRN